MNRKEKIILVGGGGHCLSVIEMIRSQGKYGIGGILDMAEKVGQQINGIEIVGTDDDIEKYCNGEFLFVISMASVKSSIIRERITEKIESHGGQFATIIASTAHVTNPDRIGQGTVVGHQALVNSEATVGKHCIVNSGAVIEHEAVIGDFCHISTNSTVNGNCKIGMKSYIGSGSVVNLGLSIADETILGSGSVATKDIIDAGTYLGIPAKKHE